MDSWLTRLIAPKPKRHGTVAWQTGSDAEKQLAAWLKEKDVRHAVIVGDVTRPPLAGLADALSGCGISVTPEAAKEGSMPEHGYALIADAAGLADASRLTQSLRDKAAKASRKLQPIGGAHADELPPSEPDGEDAPADNVSEKDAAEASDNVSEAAPVRSAEDDAASAVPATNAVEAEPAEAAPAVAAYSLNIDDAIKAESTSAPAPDVPESIPAPAADPSLNIEDAIKAESMSAPAPAADHSLNIEDAISAQTSTATPVAPVPQPAAAPAAAPAAEACYVPPLVFVPDRLDVLAFADMTAVPDAVTLLSGFAGSVAQSELQDRFLSALTAALEHVINRRTSAQVRDDALEAITTAAHALTAPLTPEAVVRTAMTAGEQRGYAAVLGELVHEAHPSIGLGEARIACFIALSELYGTDARAGFAQAALAVGCGDEKSSAESNCATFRAWLKTIPDRLGVPDRWSCLRNIELVPMAQQVSRRVKVAAPRHLSVEALHQVLRCLKAADSAAVSTAALCEAQAAFFDTGRTLSVDFRCQQLDAIKQWMETHERDILDALHADLGKNDFDGLATEVGLVREELRYMRTHVAGFAATTWYRAPLMHWPSRCFTVPEPYGRVLIMAPWNYPFLLSMDPLIGAITAGNCALLKPSNYAPAVSRLLADMVSDLFDPEYVAVVQGGREANQDLLKQPFDSFFFTGSVHVGKLVMAAASEHLTPVTLELGGKSPCIVDETADVALAARRIAWGKFINAGQTCVAPDHVFCSEKVIDKFLEALKKEITAFYGKEPLKSPDLCRIVNKHHFDRLCGYLNNGDIVIGGESDPDTLHIAPTVLKNVTMADPVMGEEIFGPVLPVMPFRDFDRLLESLRRLPKPLAGYLFTSSAAHEDAFLHRLSFGGGCINDVVVHLATTVLPFGGVGQSGMGSYHGKKSFETFSHMKPMLKKSTRFDVPIRYAPHDKKRMRWLRRFL